MGGKPSNFAGAEIAASGARTATGVGADQVNKEASGAFIIIDVTAVTGTTPTAVFKIQVKDPVTGKYVDLPGAVTASITAVGTAMLQIAPGIGAVANAAVNSRMPQSWRLAWTIGGTTPSFTFQASASYLR